MQGICLLRTSSTIRSCSITELPTNFSAPLRGAARDRQGSPTASEDERSGSPYWHRRERPERPRGFHGVVASENSIHLSRSGRRLGTFPVFMLTRRHRLVVRFGDVSAHKVGVEKAVAADSANPLIAGEHVRPPFGALWVILWV